MTLSSEEIAEIYETARSLLPAAKAIAKRARLSTHVAEDLLLEAAVQVIEHRERQELERKEREQRGEEIKEIESLPAYILTTYKHLLLTPRVKKIEKEQGLKDEKWARLPEQTDPSQVIAHLILSEEVIKHLDARASFIFEHRLLGYTYREIVERYEAKFGQRTDTAVLRSMFSKAVSKLTEELSDK